MPQATPHKERGGDMDPAHRIAVKEVEKARAVLRAVVAVSGRSLSIWLHLGGIQPRVRAVMSSYWDVLYMCTGSLLLLFYPHVFLIVLVCSHVQWKPCPLECLSLHPTQQNEVCTPPHAEE